MGWTLSLPLNTHTVCSTDNSTLVGTAVTHQEYGSTTYGHTNLVDATTVEQIISTLWNLGTTGVAVIEANSGVELDSNTLIAGFDTRHEAHRAGTILHQKFFEQATNSNKSASRSSWKVEPTSDWSQEQSPETHRVELLDGSAFSLRTGLAFGHGKHPTTKLALQLLQPILTAQKRSVLDVGTGSGVLAIAAAKLGAAHVTGIDIDPNAVVVATSNVASNQVAVSISDHPIAEIAKQAITFDVVVVNVLASVHKQLAADVLASVADGGQMILTGMLTNQAKRVSNYYLNQTADGTRIRTTTTCLLDGWVGMVIQTQVS